jgi:hypothetical protein
LWMGGHNGVEAQENKSLLRSGVARGWLGRHGCKLGTGCPRL